MIRCRQPLRSGEIFIIRSGFMHKMRLSAGPKPCLNYNIGIVDILALFEAKLTLRSDFQRYCLCNHDIMEPPFRLFGYANLKHLFFFANYKCKKIACIFPRPHPPQK